MSVIPDGFGEATVNMDFVTGPSNPMAVVFGYINDGAQAAALNAQFIRDAWNQHIMQSVWIANNVVNNGVDVLQNPGSESGSATSAFVAAGSGFSLPPQVAILVKKGTTRGGRAGRGRMYVPGPHTGGVSEGGALAAAMITDLNLSFAEFNADLGSVSIEMYLLHSTAALGAPNEVTSLQVDPIVATQRRRIR